MESISKVSADFSLELTEPHSVKILICYLLYKLEKPITPEQLYDIAVGNDIINYFYYIEAINDLINNNTIVIKNIDNQEVYVLTEKGKYGSEEFKQYVPKSFRDKLLSSALKYFAKIKQENEVCCTISKCNTGYYVSCTIYDKPDDLMNLKLFAPDEEQAKLIKDKIMLNPVDFYGKIISYVIENADSSLC